MSGSTYGASYIPTEDFSLPQFEKDLDQLLNVLKGKEEFKYGLNVTVAIICISMMVIIGCYLYALFKIFCVKRRQGRHELLDRVDTSTKSYPGPRHSIDSTDISLQNDNTYDVIINCTDEDLVDYEEAVEETAV